MHRIHFGVLGKYGTWVALGIFLVVILVTLNSLVAGCCLINLVLKGKSEESKSLDLICFGQ